MADDRPAPSTASNNCIQIILQNLEKSEEMTVRADITVGQLKAGLAERFGPDGAVLLIHGGRVLSDSELVSSLQGKDGEVQLCVRQRCAADSSVNDEDSSSQTSAFLDTEAEAQTPTSPLFLVEDLDALGLSDAGPGLLSLLQGQMEMQLLSSPEMLQRVLGSSFVQSSLSDASPELTRNLILSNPQIQLLLQTCPELEDQINNPEIIADVMVLSNAKRLFTEKLLKCEYSVILLVDPKNVTISEPEDQIKTQDNPQPKLNLSSMPTAVLELVRNPDRVMELLKNEEAEIDHASQQRPKSTHHRFTFPPRSSSSTKSENLIHPSETKPESNIRQSANRVKKTVGVFSSGPTCLSKSDSVRSQKLSMQSLLEQISSSPGLMESLLSGPHVKNLLQCLSHNPELAAQMLLSHPLLSENTELRLQLEQQIPLLLQQMQSPELLSSMLNPKAVEALLQIQQGLQTLASEAPGLIPASVLNKPESASAVSTTTDQQRQFVQQMLQTLVNSDHKDLERLGSEGC
ncbi:hypothetical protein WMY93_004079 [Mugilogobius chulae]|uniref:Ubiquitin-like domain-containing protein n=1 Tax=Mugilogobius chulae TaxID=88201 RepID=A0AAW0PRC1_9GOBI